MGVNERKLVAKFIFAAMIGLGWSSWVGANPCDSDVEKYCGNLAPGWGELENCLRSNQRNLGIRCEEWLKKMGAVLRRVGEACSTPARDYCWDVRPGYGRIKNCLMSKFEKLPEECFPLRSA